MHAAHSRAALAGRSQPREVNGVKGLGILLVALAAYRPASSGQWYSYDAATNTVTVKLEAGAPGSAGPFNFNGYTSGEATLVVPAKSNVVINFVNNDGTAHSAAVIADSEPMPNMGGMPAIPRAYTRDLTQGIPQGGTDDMTFTAPANGAFRIFCGVPGHGISGMWIRMKVDPSAKGPSWTTEPPKPWRQ
jgi:sulfocyanin